MVQLKTSLVMLACITATSFAGTALAADDIDPVRFETDDGSFTLQGGIGYTFLRGDELVYDAAGNRISHLIWESESPVLTTSAKARLPGDWTIGGSLTLGKFGDSYMEDYDWLQGNYQFENWTHQSIHPDTELHRYINADISVGRDFFIDDATTLNLHGGFKYTNVKWTAYGGSYIYSTALGFRDDIGNFPDGQAGITYEQRYPGFFLGAEATAKSGAWTFSGLARGGLTIKATDTDHHWLRPLRFEEKYDAIPFVSLGAQVDYAVNESTSVFLAGSFEQFFHKKGDTTIYDIPSGVLLAGPIVDGAGMKFRSFTISGGFKVAF